MGDHVDDWSEREISGVSTNWYEYDDDAGTAYGVQLTDGQQAVYTALGATLPTAYGSFADLQTAVPAVQVIPLGLTIRTINVTSSVFGTAQIPLLTQAAFDLLFPTGQQPFPITPFSVTESVSVTGASGEQRLSN